MMKIKNFYLILITLLIGSACGQEWLEGGYVDSSDGSDIAQYFTDPIFYSSPTGAQRNAWEQNYDIPISAMNSSGITPSLISSGRAFIQDPMECIPLAQSLFIQTLD